MSVVNDQHHLLQRIESGDQAAAEELVQRYLPEIRRAVRVRLTDPRLRRVMDSADVCQSVFANFFVRVALGEYDLNHPGDLAALLIAMARNKLVDHVRRLQSLKRDQRRISAGGDEALVDVTDPAAGPAEMAAHNDWLAEFRSRMTTDEQQLADLRGQGLEWAEIASRLEAEPDALRKKLTRAIDRIAQQLQLSEFQS
jgi:RNA polymerase sigma-70 factor (ECF subfamily)